VLLRVNVLEDNSILGNSGAVDQPERNSLTLGHKNVRFTLQGSWAYQEQPIYEGLVDRWLIDINLTHSHHVKLVTFRVV